MFTGSLLCCCKEGKPQLLLRQYEKLSALPFTIKDYAHYQHWYHQQILLPLSVTIHRLLIKITYKKCEISTLPSCIQLVRVIQPKETHTICFWISKYNHSLEVSSIWSWLVFQFNLGTIWWKRVQLLMRNSLTMKQYFLVLLCARLTIFTATNQLKVLKMYQKKLKLSKQDSR